MQTHIRTAALVAALIGFGATPAFAGHYGAYGKSFHGSGHAAGSRHGSPKYGMAHRACWHAKAHGPGYRKGPGYTSHRGWHHRHGWHGWAGGHPKGQGYYNSVHRHKYAHPGVKWARQGQADAYRAAAQEAYPAAPKSSPAAKQAVAGTSEQAATGNIVETAVAADVFTTLVSAVKAADLAETLSGEGPFTVFAPTDEAFNALPKGTVTGLLGDKDALTRVLTYHVVAGRLDAADLLEQREVETLNGAKIRLDQLRIAKADVDASNGVIHIVDQVLLPPEG